MYTSSLSSCFLDRPSYQGKSALPRGVPVYHLVFVVRAKGPGNGEEVYGLHEAGFALGVATHKEYHALRQVQIQLDKITEVGQAEMG